MFWNKKEKTITNNNIVILGGGFSGLSIGIKLLKKGFNVTIVEKEDRLGGKLEFSNNINVYPGHGPKSSIGYERMRNPFLV